jgi:hypothetical protein
MDLTTSSRLPSFSIDEHACTCKEDGALNCLSKTEWQCREKYTHAGCNDTTVSHQISLAKTPAQTFTHRWRPRRRLVAQQLQCVHVFDLGVVGQRLERAVRLVDNDEIGHLDNTCGRPCAHE